VPLAPSIVFAGTATDDRGVARVDVAIKRADTNQWLRLDGTWGVFQWLPASLASPSATSTGWTYDWTSAFAGAFTVQVRATDGAANIDPTLPSVPFTVT
jgi:hypothetical protein